jgi:hypothetical protein
MVILIMGNFRSLILRRLSFHQAVEPIEGTHDEVNNQESAQPKNNTEEADKWQYDQHR